MNQLPILYSLSIYLYTHIYSCIIFTYCLPYTTFTILYYTNTITPNTPIL